MLFAALALTVVSGFVTVSGHRMYYECSGTGSPTVVLDAGSPDTSDTWRWVQPSIAQRTRVCAYDRAGLGRSAPARGRRTALTQVHDLHGLLHGAHIPGPYVVVGHSWGGFLARLFAFSYPDETAGAVLVDATTFPNLSPTAAKGLGRQLNVEHVDISSAIAESNAIMTLGHLPLVVLGHGAPALNSTFLAAQAEEAALSSDSVDAIAKRSSHYIQNPPPTGQPGLVERAVGAVVAAVRTHQRLPSCGTLFAGSAVLCR